MEFILLIAVVVIAVLAYRSYRRTQLQTKQRDEISSAELESNQRALRAALRRRLAYRECQGFCGFHEG